MSYFICYDNVEPTPALFEATIVNAMPKANHHLFKRIKGKRKYIVDETEYMDEGYGLEGKICELTDATALQNTLYETLSAFPLVLVEMIIAYMTLETNGWMPTGLRDMWIDRSVSHRRGTKYFLRKIINNSNEKMMQVRKDGDAWILQGPEPRYVLNDAKHLPIRRI